MCIVRMHCVYITANNDLEVSTSQLPIFKLLNFKTQPEKVDFQIARKTKQNKVYFQGSTVFFCLITFPMHCRKAQMTQVYRLMHYSGLVKKKMKTQKGINASLTSDFCNTESEITMKSCMTRIWGRARLLKLISNNILFIKMKAVERLIKCIYHDFHPWLI